MRRVAVRVRRRRGDGREGNAGGRSKQRGNGPGAGLICTRGLTRLEGESLRVLSRLLLLGATRGGRSRADTPRRRRGRGPGRLRPGQRRGLAVLIPFFPGHPGLVARRAHLPPQSSCLLYIKKYKIKAKLRQISSAGPFRIRNRRSQQMRGGGGEGH